MSHRLAVPFAALLAALFLSPAEANAGEAQLRAIGSHGASYIYTTYGYIGVLADAYVKDVYDAEKVEQLMSEVIGIIDANKQNLEAVKAEGLSGDDAESVEEMIQIYALLQSQSEALIKFSKSRDPEAAKTFESTRKAVWPKIAKLLGIGASPAAASN